MRPIRSYPDEVETLAIALRDELRMDDAEAAETACFLISSNWFGELTGLQMDDRVGTDPHAWEDDPSFDESYLADVYLSHSLTNLAQTKSDVHRATCKCGWCGWGPTPSQVIDRHARHAARKIVADGWSQP